MACLHSLQKIGWNVTAEGYQIISKDEQLRDVDSIVKNALDIDIKEFGAPFITKDVETLAGPVVLQIQKLRNIAAPKSNETSGAAPRLLKLTLSDGHTTCQALELEPTSKLDIIKTAPGSKILLKKIQTFGTYLLITNSNATLLCGNVAALIEKWQLSKLSIAKRSGSDGPPPWVPFGQKVTVISDQNFKSLDTKLKEPDEFEAQREEAIAELQGAVRKTFGGGHNKPLPPAREQRGNRRPQQKPKVEKKKGKEKDNEVEVLKPTGKISLFAFLEDKLPETNKASYAEKYDASLRHREADTAPRFQRTDDITEKFNGLSLDRNNRTRNNNKVNNQMDSNKKSFDRKPPNPPNHVNSDRRINATYGKKYNNDRKPTDNGFDRKLERQQNELAVQKKVDKPNDWQWNVGDRCMAKYWEDNQYYNASVTNVTPRTCVVQFNDYGNFEEVLKVDCIPINTPAARPYAGSMIFRRGGNSNSQNDRPRRN